MPAVWYPPLPMESMPSAKKQKLAPKEEHSTGTFLRSESQEMLEVAQFMASQGHPHGLPPQPVRPVVPFQGKSQNRVKPELLTDEIWPTPVKFRHNTCCRECAYYAPFYSVMLGCQATDRTLPGKNELRPYACSKCDGPVPLPSATVKPEFPETDDEIEFLFERTPDEEYATTHSATPDTDVYEGETTPSSEEFSE